MGILAALGALTLLGLRISSRWDLLAARPWKASSAYAGCKSQCPAWGSPGIFFHTDDEQDPFIQFDLEGTHVVRRLRVENRSDGNCQSRAVPLVALTSTDGVTWTQVARQSHWFQTWDARFEPRPARYFKLMVPRRTILHLERVSLWP